ncbi:MAG: hypothetical protein RLZZ123_2400 [Pseudomonadota bacterium]
MACRIVQLGTPRSADEGVRFGSVRRPPRGVAKQDFARLDYYDVWMPLLSPSLALMQQAREVAQEKNTRRWAVFERAFIKELSANGGLQTLDAMAALSHQSGFSLGCYCEDEGWCHRGILRRLLQDRGASVVP